MLKLATFQCMHQIDETEQLTQLTVYLIASSDAKHFTVFEIMCAMEIPMHGTQFNHSMKKKLLFPFPCHRFYFSDL